MVALKFFEIDAFLARPDPGRPIVLVFGPDGGLVRERAETLVATAVDDPRDPFALVRLDGDELSDPMRLVEEANTIPLFGGRRAVAIKAGRRNILPAVEVLVASPAPDCRVIIEAGDLKRSDKLRALCEQARTAAAIACYPDGERDLARLIDEEMRAASLAIAADARATLVSLLGGDRRASRNELRKLALYARGKERVTLDDVLAVVADAGGPAADRVIDAAFAGRPAEVEVQFARACASGSAPGSIVAAALRHVAQLHKARLTLDQGEAVELALRMFIPPLLFRRQESVKAALDTWTSARLARAMAQLAEATLETRRRPALAEAIAQRALLSLAVSARRKE
jgi:DNA polymerase-3 subunit delta